MHFIRARRRAAAYPCILAGPGTARHGSLHLRAPLAAAIGAAGLVGCAACLDDIHAMFPTKTDTLARRSVTRIPLPDQALLTAHPEPDCESKSAAAQDGNEEQSGANADLALRIKLEYERACYRRAGMRIRERLQQLQASVAATIKAANSQQKKGW